MQPPQHLFDIAGHGGLVGIADIAAVLAFLDVLLGVARARGGLTSVVGQSRPIELFSPQIKTRYLSSLSSVSC